MAYRYGLEDHSGQRGVRGQWSRSIERRQVALCRGMGRPSFFRLSRGQTPPKRDAVPIGFRIDNIRWAPDGSLFGAGQGGAAPGTQTSNVVKINPNTLKIQELIRQANTDAFGSGTVAVQVGKELWVGSFRGDRIARFPVAQ